MMSDETTNQTNSTERLPRYCPNDSTKLEPREDPLDVKCSECGYTSARNLRGERIRICHKQVKITENSRDENEAYKAETEMGGLVQHIYLTREYVREQLREDADD